MLRKPIRTYQRNRGPVTVLSSKYKFTGLYPSNDSDWSFLHAKDKSDSRESNPFESTFDRVAKDAKLPPLPSPRQSERYSISSNSDDEKLMPTVAYSRKPLSKITKQSRMSKEKNKKTMSRGAVPRQRQTINRKRQMDAQNMNETDSSPKGNPNHVTKKQKKAKYRLFLEDSGADYRDSLSFTDKELKACSVSLTRVEINDDGSNTGLEIHDDEVKKTTRRRTKKLKTAETISTKDKSAEVALASPSIKTLQVCSVDLTRMAITSKNKNSISNNNDNVTLRKRKHVPRKYKIPADISATDELEVERASRATTKELKSCAVEITRLDVIENKSNNNDSISQPHDKENNSPEKSSAMDDMLALPSAHSEDHTPTTTKDCRVVLSRFNNNSVEPHRATRNMKNLMSSTPFGKGIFSKKAELKFSPIPNQSSELGNSTNPIKIDSSIDERMQEPEKNENLDIIDLVPRVQLESCVSLSQQRTQILSPTNTKTVPSSHLTTSETATQLLFDDSEEVITDTFADTTKDNSFVYHVPEKPEAREDKKANTYHLNLSSGGDISESLFDETQVDTSNDMSNKLTSMSKTYNDSPDKKLSQNSVRVNDSTGTIDISSKEVSHQSSSSITEETFESPVESTNSSSIISTVTEDSLKTSQDSNGTLSRKESIQSSPSMIDQTSNKTMESTNTSGKISNAGENSSHRDTSENDDDYQLVVSTSSSDEDSYEMSSIVTTDDEHAHTPIVSPKKTNSDKTSLPEACVLLTRLTNPVMVTNSRDKYQNWNKLSAISESFTTPVMFSSDTSVIPKENSFIEESISSENNRNEKSDTNTTTNTEVVEKSSVVQDESIVIDEPTVRDENKFVFLKPGKSWARSLSILNHIHNDDDIEAFSVGRGKKWRQSVRSILSMQSQGQLLNCVKENENEKDESTSHRVLGSNVTRISSSTACGAIESASPERFVRRVSIRVVPNNKRSKIASRDVEDTSFLEVYGIPTSKDRESIAKKSSSIAPIDTLVYNFRHSDVDIGAILPEPVVSPRNVVLQRCGQTDSLPFEECYPETFLENCRKIGEGVYGEVFLYENETERSVIKVIPIEGKELVNGEPQKKFNEILSEIIIAKELHNLRFHNTYRTNGFVEVKNIRCLEGKYPQKLVDLWRAYDDEKTSDNECPSMFSEEQLYIALELGHGGQDLEAFIFQNATEAYTLFVQTALTLAVAEKSLDFEHRDLHWGNILISRTNEDKMSYQLGDEEITFPCKGIKVAIIDFTLSRMSYQGCCMFNDLALDPALFTAMGEYQFEIYRLMKDKVGNNWQLFEPYTNILWLHYVLDKMVTAVRYKKKTSKIHKNAIQQLEELKKVVLDYDSVFDFISNCEKLPGLQRSSSST